VAVVPQTGMETVKAAEREVLDVFPVNAPSQKVCISVRIVRLTPVMNSFGMRKAPF